MQSDLYRTLCDAAEPQAPEAAQLPEYINFWKGILGGQYFLTLFNPGGGADLPPSSLIKEKTSFSNSYRVVFLTGPP